MLYPIIKSHRSIHTPKSKQCSIPSFPSLILFGCLCIILIGKITPLLPTTVCFLVNLLRIIIYRNLHRRVIDVIRHRSHHSQRRRLSIKQQRCKQLFCIIAAFIHCSSAHRVRLSNKVLQLLLKRSIHLIHLALHPLILPKRLRLAMAARQPLFKVLKVRGRHIKAATIFPALFIVGQIVAHRLLRIIKAQHHLVLVKRPVRVILVHHKHLLPIPSVYIIRHKHIDVIAIHTLRAAEVSVSVVHLALPRLSVRIHTTAHTPLRLFDTDIKRTNPNMSLPVIPRLLLCITRVRVHLALCRSNLRRERSLPYSSWLIFQAFVRSPSFAHACFCCSGVSFLSFLCFLFSFPISLFTS